MKYFATQNFHRLLLCIYLEYKNLKWFYAEISGGLSVWFDRKVRHTHTHHIQWLCAGCSVSQQKQYSRSFWNILFLRAADGGRPSQLSSRTVTVFTVVSAGGERTPWLTAGLFPAVNSSWRLTVARHPDGAPDSPGSFLRPVACCRGVMRSSFTPAALQNRVFFWPSGYRSRFVIGTLMVWNPDRLGKYVQLY